MQAHLINAPQIEALLQRIFRDERIELRGDIQRAVRTYEQIVEYIASRKRQRGTACLVLGVCGAQGSGKSTLTRVLAECLREICRMRVATLSLDDLYLPRVERERLARDVHPLLRTRGVPGTHDTQLGIEVIRKMLAGEKARVPRFDKATDDRQRVDQWDEVQGLVDVVMFEGWCIGARPQADLTLTVPINDLERESDADGRWRSYVNRQLGGPYQDLYALLDVLVMIKAPDFGVVLEWRCEQEHKLIATATSTGSATRTMSDSDLAKFVMHYERLTRDMLDEMPARADVVIALDAHRQVISLHIK
jgi:D-glycerate 3-kinase